MVPSHNGLKGALISCRAGQTKTSLHTLDQQPVQVRCSSCDRPPIPLKVQARHVCPGPKRDHRHNIPRPTIGAHSTRKLMACHLDEEWATVPVTLQVTPSSVEWRLEESCTGLHQLRQGLCQCGGVLVEAPQARGAQKKKRGAAELSSHARRLHAAQRLLGTTSDRLPTAQPPHECPTAPLT